MTLPRAEKLAASEAAGQQEELRRAGEVSAQTGIYPITGEQTTAGAYKQYLARIGQERVDIQKSRAETYMGHMQNVDAATQRKIIAALYRDGALDGDPRSLDWARQQLGIPGEMAPAWHSGQYKTAIDAAGNLMRVDTKNGQITGITDSVGRPVQTLQGRVQDAREEKDRNREVQTLHERMVKRIAQIYGSPKLTPAEKDRAAIEVLRVAGIQSK
jgi:hypothetical protein